MDSQTGQAVTGEAVGGEALLTLLRRAGQAVAGAYEPDRVLQNLVDFAAQLADGADCLLLEPSAADGCRLLKVGGGAHSQAAPPAGTRLPASACPATLFDESDAHTVSPAADQAWFPAWLPAPPSSLTYLPFFIHDDLYAALVVCGDQPLSTLTRLAIELLLTQAAAALENSRLLADTFERDSFFNALARVSLATSATLDQNAVLNLICQESMTTFDVDGVYIWQRHGDTLYGVAAQGVGHADFIGQTVPVDGPQFSARVARSGEAQFLNDFSANADVRVQLPHEKTIRAVLGIPLHHEDSVIGTLMVVDTTGRQQFSPRDISRALQFGGQAAIAIHNAHLVRELRNLNEQLDERVALRTKALSAERDRVQFLLAVASDLAASLDEERVLTRALELVNEVIRATQGVVLLPDHHSRFLRIRARFGREQRLPPGGINSTMRRDEGLAGWIMQQRQAVVIDDVLSDARWVSHGKTSTAQRSALGVPLFSGDDVIGVIMFFHRDPGAFSQEQLALVEAVAYQVANAIGNAQLYHFIQDQAEQIGAMLRQEQKEAAKNEAILQSVADGLLVADDSGRIIVANPAVSQILDVAREEILGRQLNSMLGLYGPGLRRWLAQIDDWSRSAGSDTPHAFISEELQIDGRVVNMRLAPVFSKRDFLGTVSIFRDITREREADRAKSEFVSNVSHELRTPMTSIKGYTDLLLLGAAGDMSAEQHRYLQVIKNNADRLKLLVDDLLDISRLETGKIALSRSEVDLQALVASVIDGHLYGRIHSEGRATEVTVALPADLPPVPADAEKLTRILTNLVDNALNYTEDGGRITIAARRTGRSVTIDVIDTGIGIAADAIDKIFERFYRAEEAQERMVSGTGLGLAIVRSLVDMHGGTLTVASTPGEGSTFSFDLPLDPDRDPLPGDETTG